MTVLGSAYVDIRAITDKLESDIRRSIESIKDSITIKVDADVSLATAKLDALAGRVIEQTVHVTADVDDAQSSLDDIANRSLGDQTIHVTADVDDARNALDDIADRSLGDQTIRVDVDTTAARAGLEDIANIGALVDQQTVHVDIDLAQARRGFDDMIDDMDDANPVVRPVVHDAGARTRLAFLSRMRIARINVVADSAPIKKLGEALGRLSGANVATKSVRGLMEEFATIDEKVIGISKMAIKIGTIGAAAINAVAGVMTLGAALGSVVAMAAIAAPGMFTGFIVGIGTLMVALKDFGKQLPEVSAQFKTLKNTVNFNFWTNARDSIRDMAQTLFPQLDAGVASVSGSLGEWAASLSDAIKVGMGSGVLRMLFEHLAKSIDIAKAANKPLVESFIALGNVGGTYLPRLATWFVDVSNKFGDFINKADTNGDLFRWVEEGITRLKQLGDLVGSVAGIFDSITDAAKKAGSDGLGTLVDVFGRLDKMLSSPAGMQNMTTIFEGASKAASSLGNGLIDVIGAIGGAAPVIKTAFSSVSSVLDDVAGALTTIINNPEFQKGFAELFSGIEKGVGALLPVLGTTGPKLGAFLSIIGNLAANIGGILGKALEVTLPLITALKQAIDPLIPILGDALIRIIGALAPLFTTLADTIKLVGPPITEIVKVVADLVAGVIEGIGPALPFIAMLVGGFMGAMKVMSIVSSVIGTLSSAFTVITQVVSGFRWVMMALNMVFMANPIAITIAALAALTAGVIYAYNNVGWFKDFVDGAFKLIQDVVANLVSFWNTDVVPMWNNAMKAAGEFFDGIGKWFGEAVTNVTNFVNDAGKGIGDFFGGIGGMMGDGAAATGNFFNDMGTGIQTGIAQVGQFFTDAGTNISNAWNSIWTGLTNAVAPVFELIVTYVSNGINSILTILGAIGDTFGQIFGAAWEIVTTIFSTAWETIQTVVATALSILIAFFTGNFDQIPELVNMMFVKVTGFFTVAFETIWNIVSSAWANITAIWNNAIAAVVAFGQNTWNAFVAFMVSLVTGLVTWWNSTWAGFSSFIIGLWNGIGAFGRAVWNGLVNFLVSLVINLVSGWNNMWNGFRGFIIGLWAGIAAAGRNAWNGLVSFLVSIVINCVANIRNTFNGIVGFLQGVWNNVRNGVTNAWNGIVSWIQGIPNRITSALGNLGGLLSGAGNAIMDGFRKGLEGAWEGVKSFVGGIANWIKDHKGPISYDRTLLTPAGNAIMEGLNEGLTKSFSQVRKTVKGVATTIISDTKKHLDINSPSREFQKIGTWVTIGLADGIKGGQTAVRKRVLTLAQRVTDAATEHFKKAGQKAIIKAGQRGYEIQQGRFLDQAAAQIRAQAGRLEGLAKQREALATRLKTAQKNLDTILATRNKKADEVAGSLRGEFKLSNFVGMDAKDIVAGANAIAARIRTFGTRMTQLRNLGLSANLISEVAALGSEDGISVADSLIAGGKGQVSQLNAAYKSIDASAKGTGLAVANGMYGAGVQAAQGLADGIKKNITAVDSAAKAITTRLISQVKKTLGIRSPSRVMRDQVGMQIGAGLAQGIRNSIKLVSSATSDLMDAATPQANSLSLGAAAVGPVITTGTVYGATTQGLPQSQLTPAQGVSANGGVNVNVYPSAALDEVAIGKSAAKELSWQLVNM
jgi:phage-related protein